MSLLVSESLVIAILGGALGCGAAFTLLKLFSVSADALGPFATLRIPAWVAGEALAVSILMGLLSAWIPARAAVRRNIVDSLRVID